MVVLAVLGSILLVFVLLSGIIACVAGMPGTLLILIAGVGASAATHWERPEPWVLLVLAGLALVAEAMDNVLSAMATKYHGGTSRTGWVVMVGGISGALLGSWIGPIIGSIGLLAGPVGFIIAVVLIPLALGAAGGYGAAYWYEVQHGRTAEEARHAAKGSLVGRLLGVLGKSLIGVIMSGIVMWVVFVHPHH